MLLLNNVFVTILTLIASIEINCVQLGQKERLIFGCSKIGFFLGYFLSSKSPLSF